MPSTVRAARWARVAAVASVVALGAAGCGRSGGGEGEGGRVDFCIGYFLYDRLQEPRPDDRQEALDHTEAFLRIIDRVDRRRPLTAREELEEAADEPLIVSDRQMQDLATMERSLTRLRDELRAAETPAAVRAALNSFAEDESFRAADARSTDYYRATCAVE